MKIYTIKFFFHGSGKRVIPFNYRQYQLSFLHNVILGKNDMHDDISLYSFSNLYNSKTTDNGLVFENGAVWYFRTPSTDVFEQVYFKSKNKRNHSIISGLRLKAVDCYMDEVNVDKLSIGASHIFLGQNPSTEENDHITFKHDEELSTAKFKSVFLTKSKKMGLDFTENDIDISFDKTHEGNQVVGVQYHENIKFCTTGKVNISGTKEAVAFCYAVGLGINTGSGFGFIYNINKY